MVSCIGLQSYTQKPYLTLAGVLCHLFAMTDTELSVRLMA